jgi:hypothetical protein
MINRFLLILLFSLLTACSVQVSPSAEDEQVDAGSAAQQEELVAAVKVVARMLDDGRFAEAWSLVGPSLQSQTSSEEWARNVAMMRKPLGAVERRTGKGFAFPKELDDAPPGEYGLLGASTDFANAKAVEEKFVFQRVGGKWRLVGYSLAKTITVGEPSEPSERVGPN